MNQQENLPVDISRFFHLTGYLLPVFGCQYPVPMLSVSDPSAFDAADLAGAAQAIFYFADRCIISVFTVHATKMVRHINSQLFL